ncbi:DUF4126 domain-containing protein [Deinococcus yavapaiensis]|uniref:Uncharacterized protein DUF4126 n=1 Tax=Deinococcus yavapaiensis KR-236 TaxID=694435 RepID=A0A318SD48_9DEIO|nr:DUF4126 domain-containing protein [Deinococcus yavapaiensis]PYE55324.1 uncharacterized protein DUF4126 [Deinococcus yavapaiensis KR-236]
MESLFSNLLSSLGLSGAAGLNAYIPLLTLGVLDRLGWTNLAPQYDWISSPWTLLIVGAIAVLDFIGDKVPGVDHVLHTVGGWINPLAGAVVFAANSGVFHDVNPTLALVAGALVGGAFHASRAAVRPVATATTGGIGNPVLSLLEDVSSGVLTFLAIFAPIVAVLLLVLIALVIFSAWRRWRGRRWAL